MARAQQLVAAICQEASYICTSPKKEEGEEHKQEGRGREKMEGSQVREKDQKQRGEAELLFINTAPVIKGPLP